MEPRFDTLELTEEQRARARQQIEQIAYGKWRDAGSPNENGLRFWVAAEQEWIRYYYAPCRYNGQGRPQTPNKPR